MLICIFGIEAVNSSGTIVKVPKVKSVNSPLADVTTARKASRQSLQTMYFSIVLLVYIQ